MALEHRFCQICGEQNTFDDSAGGNPYERFRKPCRSCGQVSYDTKPKPHTPAHIKWELTDSDVTFLRTQGIQPE